MPKHDSDNGSESQEMGTFETMRDEAIHFVQVKLYQKAIESFTRALEIKPDDKNCLVTRSNCWLQLGNADNALADAQFALDQDKEFVRGLYQKSEALYQKGDFETALVFYHRGHRLRPELQEFRLGIQKCQEAINNSIGTPESVKLEAKGDLSFFYKQEEEEKAKAREKAHEAAQAKEREKEARKQQRGAYQKPGATKKEERKEREHPKAPSDTKTIKQLLGELWGDREYLEKMLKDDSLTGTKTEMGKEIKDRVCDGLEYLYSRADFWRQQKPMYARKREKERMRQSAKGRGRNTMERIMRNLEDIDDAQTEGHYEESLNKSRQTLKLVESASDDEIQNKPEIIANLHSSMGNALLEMNKLHQALDHHEKDLKIGEDYDLEDARSRALDNLGRVYARKGEYVKAIEVWEKKLPLSKSPLESTWLYHEIGRCYLELGKFQQARDYGEKSLVAAQEADDDSWQLHASVLVAQSEVKLGDYQAASDSFERSLEMAKRQNDPAAEHAIKKALDDVNSKIVRGVKDGEDKDEDRASVKSEEGEDKYAEDTFETTDQGDTTGDERYMYPEDTFITTESTTDRSPPAKPEPRPASRPKSVSIKEEPAAPSPAPPPVKKSRTPSPAKSPVREPTPAKSPERHEQEEEKPATPAPEPEPEPEPEPQPEPEKVEVEPEPEPEQQAEEDSKETTKGETTKETTKDTEDSPREEKTSQKGGTTEEDTEESGVKE